MALKILVVEDSESERRTLLACLAQHPAFSRYAVVLLSAADGEQALGLFREALPDLVITDLLLPRLDGFALCAAIRALPEGRERPIIAVSGVYRDSGSTAQLRERHGVDLLPKPIDLQQLRAKALVLLQEWAAKTPGAAARWPVPEAAPAANERPEAAAPAAEAGEPRGADTPPSPAAQEAPAPGAQPPAATRPDAAPRFDRAQRGALQETPLARLLVEAALARATGTLQLTRGKMEKRIHLHDGAPVYVDSDLRSETLGAFLVAQNTIDEAQLSRAMAEARKRGSKLGESLLSLGIIDAGTLSCALRSQTQLKLAGALRWAEGAFVYTPGSGRAPAEEGAPVDAVRFVLAALKRFIQPEQLTSDLARGIALTPGGETQRAAIDEIFGPRLLAACAGGAPLSAAVDAGMSVGAVSVQAAALRLAGLAAPSAPAEPAEPAPAAPTAPTTSAEPVAPATAPRFDDEPDTPLPSIPPALGDMVERSHTFDGLFAVGPTGPASPRIAAAPPAPEFATPIVPVAAPPVDSPAAAVLVPPPPPREPTVSEELELETPSYAGREPAAIQLEHLAGGQPPGTACEIELELPQATASPLDLDEDSGVLDLLDLDGLELEERQTPAGLARHDPAALSPPPLPLAPPPATPISALPPPGPALVVHQTADPVAIARAFATGDATEADLPDLAPGEVAEAVPTPETDPFGARREQPHDERLAAAKPQALSKGGDRFGAELFFQDGRNRLRTNDLEGALRAFAGAIESHPQQPDYHAFYGWALFVARGRGEGGAIAARPHLARALELVPDSPQAHELAAQVERDVRNHRAAAEHLAQALASGPPRSDLFEQLRDELSALGDFAELERQYRLMVFRLRDADLERAVPLWVDLAYLYFNKLGQPKEARIALEVVSGMAPDDPRVRAAQASIGCATAEAWEPIAEGYRQRLLSAPDDASPLHELFTLHRARNNGDQLLLVAGLLAAREEATAEELAAYQQLRAPALVRSATPVAALVDQLRDPADALEIEQVIALLAPTISACFPLTLEDLGSDESQRLAEIALPQPFGDVLRQVCAQLARPLPALYLATGTAGIQPAPTPWPQLLVSQELLQHRDEGTIAFAAARAVSCIDPGRAQACGRRARQLKTAFLAAHTLTRPHARVPDGDGEIARFRATLARHVDPEACAALIGKLRGRTVNLSRWVRAVHRTAARIGLLVCGDPGRALPLVADAAVRADLTGFALSERYAQLRAQLRKTAR